MDISQLKCFLAVAREGNFTRAARACHLAQPSLSYQIARLEEELGVPLFLRKPRRVELSEGGKRLLESAGRIVEEQERALALFRSEDGNLAGELRFGIIPTMAPYLLPSLLAAFRERHPAVRLVAREARTAQLVREVVEGEVEFAVVSDLEAAQLRKFSLHLAPLIKEGLLLATPAAHPLSVREPVSAREVNQRELILLGEGNCLRDQTLQLCRQREAASPLACEQLPTLLAMVAAGLGVAVVPEMAVAAGAPPGVSLAKFEEPAPARTIGLLKKRGVKLGPGAEELVATLKKKLRKG